MRKLDEKTLSPALSLVISVVLVNTAVVEILVAYYSTGMRGVNSFFIVEAAIIIFLTLVFIVFVVIKKRLAYKLLLFNLFLLMASMLAVIIQFFPVSLASTMPYRYHTMGKVYGICYRIDLLQDETMIGTVLNIRNSFYIINLNLILSIVMTAINATLLFKRIRSSVERAS